MDSSSTDFLHNLLMRTANLSPPFSKNLLFRKRHIDPTLRRVQQSCRDKNTINDALDLIPVAEIVQDNQEILEDPDNYHENLLTLITRWFAEDFFTWFRAPSCDKCSCEMVLSGTTMNKENKMVEHYKCKRHDHSEDWFDFIRHNEPAILLRTRTGRCGEWANCFMTILLALDYHVRMVVDSTDHVWNEVWSEVQSRWVHVDPCECTIDKPLLYELGWSKKLQYCLAFGQSEVLDVTPRYCLDFSVTKTRRTQVDEDWLYEQLDQISSELLNSMPDEKLRQSIRHRRELDKKFLQTISSKPQDIPESYSLGGRKTGDLSWRIQRGEVSPLVQNKCYIKVSRNKQTSNDENNTRQPIFSISYNCDKNRYDCIEANYKVEDWSSLTYEYENIEFKYERDWRTSYLARYESCPHDHNGRITWRFDLTDLFDNDHGPDTEASTWREIQILVRGKEYPNTSLHLVVDCRDIDSQKVAAINLEVNVLKTIQIESLPIQTRILDLTATLSGGCRDDSVAWQKPQLFRQTRGQDSSECSFIFTVS